MSNHDELIGLLQQGLDQAASQKTKDWWEKYLRETIRFRGVGIPEIRKLLAVWREETGIASWDKADQLDLALRLFAEPMAEDKLSGILFLQEYLYDQFAWELLLERYAALYRQNLIFDWNTCDWFCVRVLGPTIKTHGEPCAQAITAWRHADRLWQARSSVVAFVPISSEQQYDAIILESCAVLIRREERFAKTGVGWILREISRRDAGVVRAFVDQHLGYFSLEALRNALKYAEKQTRQDYVDRLKAG